MARVGPPGEGATVCTCVASVKLLLLLDNLLAEFTMAKVFYATNVELFLRFDELANKIDFTLHLTTNVQKGNVGIVFFLY